MVAPLAPVQKTIALPGPCAEYARLYPAVRIPTNIHTCQEESVYYNAPCTAETIDCLLFRKASFMRYQQGLRGLLAVQPTATSSAAVKDAWCRSIVLGVETALDDTNIRSGWLLGHSMPVGPSPEERSHPGSLPAALWPRTRAFVQGLHREAFNLGSPVVMFPPETYVQTNRPGANYHTPNGETRYHNPGDFVVDVSGVVRSASGGTREVRGAGDRVGAMSEPRQPPRSACGVPGAPYQPAPDNRRVGDKTPMSWATRRALEQEGVQLNPYWPAHFAGIAPRVRRASFEETGSELPLVSFKGGEYLSRYGLRAHDALAHCEVTSGWYTTRGVNAAALLGYYVSLAQDVVAMSFEMYVLYGVEMWASNMAVWAQRGYLALPAADFVELAREAAVMRPVALAGGAWSMGASLISAINPLAGMIVGLVPLLLDVLAAAGAMAVGGWQCPYPLTRRSASGDCDFTVLLGAAAQERARKQREGMEDYFSGATGEDLAARRDALGKSGGGLVPWLIGAGGLVGGLGLAYLLGGKR